MMNRRSRLGFTLAEMLLVIAIILILAALLYPVFLGARETGYASTCQNNLHQLQIAVENYASDNTRYPPAVSVTWKDVDGNWWHRHGWVSWADWTVEGTATPVTPVTAPGTPHFGYSWRTGDTPNGNLCISNGCLWTYVNKEKGVYLCPTFAQKKVCGWTDAVRSYCMNTNLDWRNLFDPGILPSQMILFGDAKLSAAAPTKYDSVFLPPADVAKYHRTARGNVVYLDGHVERMQ